MIHPTRRHTLALALALGGDERVTALAADTDGIDDAGSKTLRDAFKRYGGASLFAPGHSPLGLLPALYASKRPLPSTLNRASAITLRAELPVHSTRMR